MCWLHGMGGIEGLGMDAHGDCTSGISRVTNGGDWVMVMVGWVLGEGGAAGVDEGSENWGGL